ncbi:MAG: hypothetical protein GXO86_13785, partial [Chlorobi bacterium]|nr:hypothetical protein [Chlorobiota bacterium]
ITIDRFSEKPDFILEKDSEIIGLEHQIVVDRKSKEREGFFENIFNLAEHKLKTDNSLPNFLANCNIKPYVNFRIKEKQDLVSTIVTVIKTYVITNKLIENPIIERISIMPHSGINISGNLGAWWQKNITNDILITAINKKERLISEYKKNCGNKQWLLIVIGGTGESSYVMDKNIKLDVKSEFDRIFLLEDFYNNLYELK